MSTANGLSTVTCPYAGLARTSHPESHQSGIVVWLGIWREAYHRRRTDT
jgi:ribosome modulation factor